MPYEIRTLLEQLEVQIANDRWHLTRTDQEAAYMKLVELRNALLSAYDSHQIVK